MTTLCVNATINEDGSINLQNLPFKPGAAVSITIVYAAPPDAPRYPLRGSVLRYDDPFEPAVPPEDWEALQ